jgi:hypothetical protein
MSQPRPVQPFEANLILWDGLFKAVINVPSIQQTSVFIFQVLFHGLLLKNEKMVEKCMKSVSKIWDIMLCESFLQGTVKGSRLRKGGSGILLLHVYLVHIPRQPMSWHFVWIIFFLLGSCCQRRDLPWIDGYFAQPQSAPGRVVLANLTTDF